MAGNLNVSLVIKAFDRATAPIRAVTRNFQAMRQAKVAADRQFAKAGNIRNAAEGVKRFSDAAVSAMKAPISEFENFEAAMSGVRAVTRSATDEEFAELTTAAKDLGATTRFTAEQAAQGFKFLGMAGFDATEQMSALPPMLDLATAGGTDLGRTADIVSDLLGAFGMNAADTTAMTDQLAVTMTGANVTLETMFETMKLAGPVATKLNISMADVAAMTGLMGSAGIKGSMAGTALKASMQRLVDPSAEATAIMQKLNVQLADEEENLRPMTDLLAEVASATDGMGTALRGAIVGEVFGVRAISAMTTLMDKAEAGEIKKFSEQIRNSAGAAKEMATIMDDNAKGATIRLTSAFSGLMTTLGEKLAPTLTALKVSITAIIQVMTAWVNRNPRLAAALAIVAGAVTVLAVGLTGLMFTMAAATTAMGVMSLGLGGWKTAVTVVGTAIKKLIVTETVWQVVSARSGAMVEVQRGGIVNLAKSIWAAAIPALGGMATAAWGVASGVIAATWPILAIIAAIAAAVAIVYLAIKYWDDLVAIFDRFTEASLATKVALGLLVGPFILLLSPLLAIAWVAKRIIDHWEPLKYEFKQAWAALGKGTTWTPHLFKLINPLLYLAILPLKLMRAWEPVKTFFADLWKSVTDSVMKAMAWLNKVDLPAPLRAVMKVVNALGNAVISAAEAVGGTVKDVAKEAAFVITGEADTAPATEPVMTLAETAAPVMADYFQAAGPAMTLAEPTTPMVENLFEAAEPAARVAEAAKPAAKVAEAAKPAKPAIEATPPAGGMLERLAGMMGGLPTGGTFEGKTPEVPAEAPFLGREAAAPTLDIGEGLLHIKIDSDKPVRVVEAEPLTGIDLDVDTGLTMATAG